MTATINGIGTHYFGRKNVVERPAQCVYCGKVVSLASYDTRTWFVVVFLPVIPLQKLRILDQCPRCTRHKIVPFTQWTAIQGQARKDASSTVQMGRDDPDSAIAAHRKLLGAQLMVEADALADAMRSRFAGVAIVHVHLADIASALGRSDEAQAGYARAFELDPNLPAAREGVAVAAVSNRDLDRALELLKPLIEGRTVRGPGASCALGGALVHAKRQAEAYPILKSMLEQFPGLSQDKAFAKQLRACEKSLGTTRTKLAMSRKTARRWIVAASLLALATVGVVIGDRLAAGHVTLYVIDSANGALHVIIPGAGSLEFKKPGRQELALSEGSYVAQVSGAVKREIPFKVHASRWPSFIDDTTYVLDASGESLLWFEHCTYSSIPAQQSTKVELVEAAPFNRFPSVDFPFCKMPETVPVSSSTNTAEKTGLDFMPMSPEAAVFQLISAKEVRQALDFAQTRLQRTPDSAAMLMAYAFAANAAHQVPRADAYLAKRLDARPVDIPAHRAWMAMHSDEKELADVSKRYEKLLAREPDEAAWALFAGGMSPSMTRRLELLGRASADERTAPFAWTQLAEAQSSAGDFGSALASAEHALEGDVVDYQARMLRHEALLALGRTQELQQILIQELTLEPCDFDAQYELAEVVGASGDDKAVSQVLGPFQKEAGRTCAQDYARTRALLQIGPYWSRGDYRKVVQLVDQSADPMLFDWKLVALAEAGRVDELHAFSVPSKKGPEADAFTALAMDVACREARDVKQAETWEKMGLGKLSKSAVDTEVARVVGLKGEARTQAAFDLALRPRDKAILLALVSFSDEKARARLLSQALALRPAWRFPHALLERMRASAIQR